MQIQSKSACAAAVSGPSKLTYDNYYRFRDVERVPKALRMMHEQLTKHKGGILSLDTDLPDTYMNSHYSGYLLII